MDNLLISAVYWSGYLMVRKLELYNKMGKIEVFYKTA